MDLDTLNRPIPDVPKLPWRGELPLANGRSYSFLQNALLSAKKVINVFTRT